jgi:hypothetical protein
MIRELSGKNEPRAEHGKPIALQPVNMNDKSEILTRTFETQSRIDFPNKREY